MSGTNFGNPCPVCQSEMNCNSDYKPFDNVNGECLTCGFSYYTESEQMDLESVNDARAEYNEGNELTEEDEKFLKPLKQEDLDKYKKDIEML